MQIVLVGNRVVAHGDNCFLCMGGTVICEETGKAYPNATVAEVETIPADIDTVGYEYHAGVFVPCAPYGVGAGELMVACEDCGTPKRSKVTADAEGGLHIPGYLTGAKIADETAAALGLTDATVDGALEKVSEAVFVNPVTKQIEFFEDKWALSDLAAHSGSNRSFGYCFGKLISTSWTTIYYSEEETLSDWKMATCTSDVSDLQRIGKIVCDGNIAIAMCYSSSGAITNSYLYSYDGVEWHRGALPAQPRMSIACGNGVFVVPVYSDFQGVWISENGLDWTPITINGIPSGYYCNSADYGNGRFAVIGGSRVAYSVDGRNWTTVTTSQEAQDIVGGTRGFIKYCFNATAYLMYSRDGSSWTSISQPSFSAYYPGGAFFTENFIYMTNAYTHEVHRASIGETGNPSSFSAVSGVNATHNTPAVGYFYKSGTSKLAAINFGTEIYMTKDEFETTDYLTDVHGNELNVAGVKIATGSYTGTGSYGSSNKNSITFEFEPKLVIIEAATSGTSSAEGIHSALVLIKDGGFATQYVSVICTWEGNSVSWYNTQNAYKQYNRAVTYRYIAIG